MSWRQCHECGSTDFVVESTKGQRKRICSDCGVTINEQKNAGGKEAIQFEDTDTEHIIHSFGDISHMIKYELSNGGLEFDSMEHFEIAGDSLDMALQVEHVHCTCGKTNMSRKEAIDHLKKTDSCSESNK